MRRLRSQVFIKPGWNLLASLILLLSLYWLYFWRLSSLVPGLSAAEVSARSASASWQIILANPLFLPHKLLQHSLLALHNGNFSLRATSAIWAGLFLLAFYHFVRIWFGKTIGTLASLLIAATPWIVILGRQATPEVMFLSPIIFLALYTVFLRAKKHLLAAWIGLCFGLAICLYTPGLIWLISLAILIGREQILAAIKRLSGKQLIFGTVILLLGLIPLFRAFILSPHLIKSWLLIPAQWPSIIEQSKLLLWAILSFFWHTRQHLDINIGRLPILNITALALVIFGSYAVFSRLKRSFYLLMLIILIPIILSAFNASAFILTLALPAIFILLAAGLRYLYIEWLSVFPRNPLPRILALILIGGLVSLQLFFGYYYAQVAWPHTYNTKKTYVLK